MSFRAPALREGPAGEDSARLGGGAAPGRRGRRRGGVRGPCCGTDRGHRVGAGVERDDAGGEVDGDHARQDADELFPESAHGISHRPTWVGRSLQVRSGGRRSCRTLNL